MNISVTKDLWEMLADSPKHKVLYGMGNGADKILAVCAEKGVSVCDVFASDGFVRGHLYRGKPVLTWSGVKEKYGAENVIVLLSFGTARPEVLANIERISKEAELYAPDVPAFGNGLFDLAFFESHRKELAETYFLLGDETSRRIFENIIRFKLTGKIEYLRAAESDPETVMRELICPETIRTAVDLGAYNGDTVRELLDHADGNLQTVLAVEPDARNFRRLQMYAAGETRAQVLPACAGAWNEDTRLCFDDSGNRNASFGSNRSVTLQDRPVKLHEVSARTLDSLVEEFLPQNTAVDYIKYDVEGSEKEALLGSSATVRRSTPTLLVSLYHRNEDLFALPLLIKERFPDYRRFYLRRFPGVPAWDLNLYCKK